LSNCHSIEERPKVVDRRTRLGDWEANTFLGKNHKPVMVSLTEPKSRFTLLRKLPQRTAQAVRKQTVRLLLPVSDKVQTLTSDHGKEFACHQQIAQALQLQFYFAHPYAAWERGTNENTNSLL
jgi:IS30 family transposase